MFEYNKRSNALAGIIAKHLSIVEVAVDAALKGDRGLFAEAILMSGCIIDRNSVNKMVDELIGAQKQYLSQFYTRKHPYIVNNFTF